MAKIVCPCCNKAFTLANDDYAKIASQIRTAEFEAELVHRMGQILDSKHAEYDVRLRELKLKHKSDLMDKDSMIQSLRDNINIIENNYQTKMIAMADSHRVELALKDEQIAMYRDFKSKQSTKMIGESLELHCMSEFNRYRAIAFPNAYFEKDNDVKSGTKGDFIFRDFDDGIEFISIMFEMKNEADTTRTKHKNEDFLNKLDQDRRKKNCEYAVLVTTLEADNDFYNEGIVDVSHKYDKMYIIRPQYFITLIGLLRNAARSSLDYKRQLSVLQAQQIDVSMFEQNLDDFKSNFATSYDLASKKFDTVISDIDAMIAKLEDVKAGLLSTGNSLRIANDKAAGLTIRKLVKNSPSIKHMIKDQTKKNN